MSENDNQTKHDIITTIGVGAFVVLIGVFWWKGLPNLFKNSNAVPPVVHSLKDQWEEINATAAQTQNLLEKQQQANRTTEDITSRVKEILSTTAKAADTSTTTP